MGDEYANKYRNGQPEQMDCIHTVERDQEKKIDQDEDPPADELKEPVFGNSVE
jgi:hypothetical protein